MTRTERMTVYLTGTQPTPKDALPLPGTRPKYCRKRRKGETGRTRLPLWHALSGEEALGEGVSTRATAARVGVVDREALLLDRVLEVDRRAIEVRNTHLVH